MALIYPFLSARRKVQADGALAIEFLEGISPEGFTTDELLSLLRGFNDKKKSKTWRGSDRGEIRRANYQKRKAEDPAYVSRLVERNKAWKSKQEEQADGSENS